MPNDDQPTREELIAARERLAEQLSKGTIIARDRNTQLENKLEAMIAEIDALLGESKPDGG